MGVIYLLDRQEQPEVIDVPVFGTPPKRKATWSADDNESPSKR